MDEHTFDTRKRRIVSLTEDLAVVTLERLGEIADFDTSQEYLADGYTSVAAFLVHRCGMGVREANRQVFLARALDKAPYAAKLTEAGQLSVNQFEVLAHAQAKHPEPYEVDEPALCEAAEGLGLADTRRLVAYWCQAHCEPADDAAIDPSQVFLAQT